MDPVHKGDRRPDRPRYLQHPGARHDLSAMAASLPLSIALVTCEAYPDLTADDRLLLPALERFGLRPVPARWDDPGQRWETYGAVVLRSCWDYHHRFAEFVRWLHDLERAGARVHNPVRTLRWNMRKTYLRHLEAAGIPVAGTVWATMRSTTSLRDIRRSTGWDAMVVKPTVSASAWETWLTDGPAGAADEERFARLLRDRDLMVQPFLPSIVTEGELSLVFIAGEFSHAVRKRPKPGDFRVQEEHGGTAEREPVTPELVRQARRALDAAPGPGLYARADGVVVDGRLVITELELVEPMLYLGWDSAAAGRLAAGIERALRPG
jgi:glutathione synthase/RimK-type ligase-like ATP-grasp enzyme